MLTSPTGLWGHIWPRWPIHGLKIVEIQGYWCGRLVEGMSQLRHLSTITLSHTHTITRLMPHLNQCWLTPQAWGSDLNLVMGHLRHPSPPLYDSLTLLHFYTASEPVLTNPAGLGVRPDPDGLLFMDWWWLESRLLVWETCLGHDTAQAPIHHTLTVSHSYKTHTTSERLVLTNPSGPRDQMSDPTLMASCSLPKELNFKVLVGGMTHLRHPSITLWLS